jgi:hypothetical protein
MWAAIGQSRVAQAMEPKDFDLAVLQPLAHSKKSEL